IGQPLHAFDLDRLAGRRVVVRKARRGEKLVTLDGIERNLDPSDIVVADAERAGSLAGGMGGLNTAVTAATPNAALAAPRGGPPLDPPALPAPGPPHRRVAPLRARRGPRGHPGGA